MNKKLVLLIIVVAAGAGFWIYDSQKTKTGSESNQETINQTTNNDSKKWTTYSDEKYKFSIDHPQAVPQIVDDLGNRTIAIKNYEFSAGSAGKVLQGEDFYIDIYVTERDHEKVPCATDLKNITQSKIGSVTVYRGVTNYSMIQEGDQSALCLEDQERNIRVIVVEPNDKTNKIAPKVLDSFKFTN